MERKLRFNRKIVLSAVIPASIVVGVSLYFLNMPAWLMTERVEPHPDRHVIEIPQSVLADHPKLEEAIDKAERGYDPRTPGTALTRASFLEGKEIEQAVKNQDTQSVMDARSFRYFVESEGKQYSLIIQFDYRRPILFEPLG